MIATLSPSERKRITKLRRWRLVCSAVSWLSFIVMLSDAPAGVFGLALYFPASLAALLLQRRYWTQLTGTEKIAHVGADLFVTTVITGGYYYTTSILKLLPPNHLPKDSLLWMVGAFWVGYGVFVWLWHEFWSDPNLNYPLSIYGDGPPFAGSVYNAE